MDWKSHKLFTNILLDELGEDTDYDTWAQAPDMDMKFLHRWWRHRFSVIDDIYEEGYSTYSPPKHNPDKDAIILSVVSHCYLDIFNGWVMPFGLWYPIYPKNTIINDVLDDITNPKLVIDQLYRLGFKSDFSDKFYIESETIMRKFISDLPNVSAEKAAAMIIYRLAGYASMKKRFTLKNKALCDMAKFAKDEKYKTVSTFPSVWRSICERFETDYCKLLNRMMEGEFGAILNQK